MNKKKFISLCIAAVMAANAVPTTVFAASVGSDASNTSVGEDTAQSVKTVYSELGMSDAQTEVYLTVDDKDLIASLPTTIVLSGTPNSEGKYIGKYSIGVSGDISGSKLVNIEPESENVTLKQKWKNDKTATISQEQTLFNTDDFKNQTTTTGSVTADKLTAGSWNGNFNFNISYNGDKQFDGYTVLYRYDLSATTKDKVYAYYLVPNKNTESIQSDGSTSKKVAKKKSRAKARATSNTTEIEHDGIKYTLSDNDKLVITGDGTVKSNIINDLGDQEAIQKAVEEHYKDKYPTTPVEKPTNDKWNSMSTSERQNLHWYKWTWEDGTPTITEYSYKVYNYIDKWKIWSLNSSEQYYDVKNSNQKIDLCTYPLTNASVYKNLYTEILTYKDSIASDYSISCPKTVVLSQNVTKIGNSSFAGMTSLENIQLSSSLTEIGNNAFKGCTNLKSINFNEGLQKFGNSAFFNCKSLRSVKLPTTLTSIGDSCFENCSKLLRFNFNNCSITSIPNNLLKNTIVYSVIVPDTVLSIGYFSLYNVKHVEIPNGVKILREHSLYNVDDIYIPSSVDTLEKFAITNAATVYIANEEIELEPASVVGNSNGKIYCYSQNLADKVNSIDKILTTDKKNNYSPSVVAKEKFSSSCASGNHNYEITQYGNCIDLSDVSNIDDIKDTNVRIYTCKDCGHKKYELNPDNHDYELHVTKAATCTEAGEGKNICKHCNHWTTAYVPPTGHHVVDGVCVRCGEKIKDSYDISTNQDGSLLLTYDNDQNYTIKGTGTLAYQWQTLLMDPDKYVNRLNAFAAEILADDPEADLDSQFFFADRSQMEALQNYIQSGKDTSDLASVLKKFNVITWSEWKSMDISNEQFLKKYAMLSSSMGDFKECYNLYLDYSLIKSIRVEGSDVKIGASAFDFVDYAKTYYLGSGVTYVSPHSAFQNYNNTKVYCKTQAVADLFGNNYSNIQTVVDSSKF